MDISENWTFFFILPSFFLFGFSGKENKLEKKIKKKKNGHFMLWRISELLGRAGFEPA